MNVLTLLSIGLVGWMVLALAVGIVVGRMLRLGAVSNDVDLDVDILSSCIEQRARELSVHHDTPLPDQGSDPSSSRKPSAA